MSDIFSSLVDRIEGLQGTVKKYIPALRWAVIVSVTPLKIRFDLETVDVSPATLTTDLIVGERVYCAQLFGQTVVLGRAKAGPRSFPDFTALDAWEPADGATGFVEDTGDLYLRTGGAWESLQIVTPPPPPPSWVAVTGFASGWSTPPAAPLKYRVKDGYLEMKGSLYNSGFTGGFTTIFTLPIAPPETAVLPMSANASVHRSGQIGADGKVYLYASAASGAWFAFDQVRIPLS